MSCTSNSYEFSVLFHHTSLLPTSCHAPPSPQPWGPTSRLPPHSLDRNGHAVRGGSGQRAVAQLRTQARPLVREAADVGLGQVVGQARARTRARPLLLTAGAQLQAGRSGVQGSAHMLTALSAHTYCHTHAVKNLCASPCRRRGPTPAPATSPRTCSRLPSRVANMYPTATMKRQSRRLSSVSSVTAAAAAAVSAAAAGQVYRSEEARAAPVAAAPLGAKGVPCSRGA